MNVIWRTLLTILRARRRVRRNGHEPVDALYRMSARVLPTDIDILRHLNNGRYLSLFDLGRWDMMVRSGVAAACRSHGWYPVVSSETITFRKSLQLWQRFGIETRWTGHDDRALYLEHRAVVRGEIYARAIIRARIVGPDGPVPLDEVFAAVELPEGLPEVAAWTHDWAEAVALPSTRRPAPSVWE